MEGIKILATGYYVPPRIVTNATFEEQLDTSDAWITSRTGISKRHFVDDQSNVDIGYAAAMQAIENESIDAAKIGLIIVATMTPDTFTPSTACLIQERLGLSQEVIAFDISAACSGFVYGLTIMERMLSTMPDKYGLLIGSEVLSRSLDFTDRNTCILFGEGAGAVVVTKRQQLFSSYLDARGEKEGLYMNAVGTDRYLHMAGKEIFKFAVQVIPVCIHRVLQQTDLTLESIDFIVCHQANARIIKYVYEKLKCDPHKFYCNVQDYGNTSAASIPMALAQMDAKGMLQRGMKIICVGFGGGLTWGATILEW